jgi:long-chain acyl-CoA synthetase
VTFRTEISGPDIIEAPALTWIFDQLEDWARRSPDRVAFVLDHHDKVQEYRYADVLSHAGFVAAALKAQGIERGDHVGVLMENVPQWVFVLLGAMGTGAVTVPLATTLPENSVRLIAEHAGCKVIFADEANWEKATTVAAAVGCKLLPAQLDHATWNRDRLKSISGSDTALLIYTSGTTGNPKGVELSFENLNYEIRGAIESLRMTPDHRILSVLPFSHVLPLIANGLGPLCIGACVVFLSSISPQRIVDTFHRQRITFFICVPQFFYILHKRIFSQVESQPFMTRKVFGLMKSIARKIPSPALRRKLFAKVHESVGKELRLLASGGSHFDSSVAEDLNDIGYTVLQAYGLTETSAAATITPPKANRIGTVGTPIRGVTIRIDNPNEKGVGEVLISGPVVMKGYYHAPEKTTEAIKNGWFLSGDLGCIDSDGYLSITGRSKDVIVLANGENVYPEELETHYSKSPFIKEICVVGISENGTRGGTLHGIVVPDMEEFKRRGQTAIMEMIRFEIENLSKQVPSFYRIHSLAIRNEPFPRTVTRKLKRFEIQQEEVQRKEKETKREAPSAAPAKEDPRFQSRTGAVIAELIRESKPKVGVLSLSMNIELDLGFDSLARVELLGLAEARLGAHIDEQQASRIYTLGELIDALEAAAPSETMIGRSWKEIVETATADEQSGKYLFGQRPLLNPVSLVMMRVMRFAAQIFFRLRCVGLEKLPKSMPFLICPNHESFLDGPLVVSVLPRLAIYNLFILGYSDYWQSAFSRFVAELCKIVPIDPNANLIRAMQVGAFGLKQGRVLLIFPEGTRSIDGNIDEFRKGSAILAYELGVPIVPVGIRGSFEAWPRGGSLRPHRIEFHFGDPIDPRAFAKASDPYAAITETLRGKVKELAGQ